MLDDDDADDNPSESGDFSSYDYCGRYRPHMTEVTPPKNWNPDFRDDPYFGNERIFSIEQAVYERDIDFSSPFKPVLSWDDSRRGTSHNSRFGLKTYKETMNQAVEKKVLGRIAATARMHQGKKQGPDISPPGADFVNDEYTPVYSLMPCSDLRDKAYFLLKQTAFCRRVIHEATKMGDVAQVFATEREMLEHQTHLRRIRVHLTSRNRRHRF
jgi:hypothetical protein